jgi:endonuclease/exonuclease/phosphatase family metal-dependent hydrolase
MIRWRLTLVAVSVTLAVQTLRALFPLVIYTYGAHATEVMRGAYLVVVFLAPLLAPALARLLNARRALTLAVGGLALFRLAAQVAPPGDAALSLATIAAVLALAALPLALRAIGATDELGIGIFWGLALDAALNSAFVTWDYFWQRDTPALVTALALSGLAALALWQEQNRLLDMRPFKYALPFLLGPAFLLEMLLLANPAYVAANTGFDLPIASAVVLLGLTLALAARSPRLAHPRMALVLSLLLLNNLTGIPAAVIILVAQTCLGYILFAELTSPAAFRPGAVRTAFSAAVGSLSFLVLLLLFHAADLVAIPLSVAPPLAGIVIALLVRQSVPTRLPFNWRVLPLPLFVVPLALWLTQPPLVIASAPSGAFRLFNYNVHQGANEAGWVDLEGLAAAIEADSPDVVALQEATRGQLANGSADLAIWLSRRLRMPYVFAPAITGYGNALLTRLPILAWDDGPLPRGEAEPRRYLRAQLDVGRAEPVAIIVTHLNHLSARNRIPQVERLLAVWNGAPRTLLVGDLNAQMESTEIMMIMEAGFISAQDVTGHSDLFTFSSTYPRLRIDWIFGTPDITFSDFKISPATASDHLPLAVTVRVE